MKDVKLEMENAPSQIKYKINKFNKNKRISFIKNNKKIIN
jgi:hypothetical protein